jgi:hypothetical protein
MQNKKKNLILIELNELNFTFVKKYLDNSPSKNFVNFKKLQKFKASSTVSEKNYANLEPWIQWVSAHTGKTFSEHKVFRLGDINKFSKNQIFEIIEKHGYKVGAISPINTKNNLSNPAYFIPDPWVETLADNSWWSKNIAKAISQTVNDNSSSKITVKSACILLLAFFRFSQFKNYFIYFKLALRSLKHHWCKALFLDLFLSDLHKNYFLSCRPNFSVLFLNAGAHIQHHYFFNSKYAISKNRSNPEWYIKKKIDPFIDLLEVYDIILKDQLDLACEKIVATGLSQKPYDRLKYYYRLKNHKNFLNKINIQFLSVHPRMTRDFLIEFKSNDLASTAEYILRSIKVLNGGEKVFGEIDNRGKSLFVTLTYPKEIEKHTKISCNTISINLYDEVVFVAIKNGMHQGKGYSFYSKGIEKIMPRNKSHVKAIFSTINQFFLKRI